MANNTLTEQHRPDTPNMTGVTDPDRLVLAGELVTTTASYWGAAGIGLARTPTRPSIGAGLLIRVRFALGGEEPANGYRAQIPALFKPSVEGTNVFFEIPVAVCGDHGKIGTYSNHRCRGPLCRIAWRQQGQSVKQDRADKIEFAERVRLDDGRVVSYIPVPLSDRVQVVEHGTASTYTNWSCRCELCTEAWAADALGRKHRRRLAAALKSISAFGGSYTVMATGSGVTVEAVLAAEAGVGSVSDKVMSAGLNPEVNGLRVVFDVPQTLADAVELTPDPVAATG